LEVRARQLFLYRACILHGGEQNGVYCAKLTTYPQCDASLYPQHPSQHIAFDGSDT
jgi:hypothetical protein